MRGTRAKSVTRRAAEGAFTVVIWYGARSERLATPCLLGLHDARVSSMWILETDCSQRQEAGTRLGMACDPGLPKVQVRLST